MYRIYVFFAALVLAGTLCISAAANAHGIWLAERSDQLAVIYGIGGDDLDMVKRFPKITSIAAYDVMQEPVETSLSVSQYLVVVDTSEHPAIVAAVLNNGLWSKTPEGEWLQAGRDEVPNATIAERTYKFAVHLRSPLAEPLGVLPGQKLQIIPDDAILPDKMGADLPVSVLYNGKPAAGARIIVDFLNDPDAEPIIVGEDGRATVKIRNQGLNVIGALYDSPSEDPGKSDKTESMATLSFVLPHEPE